MRAVKSSGKTTFEEARIDFTKDEVEVAQKWLVKYATNEAVFFVRKTSGRASMAGGGATLALTGSGQCILRRY